MAYMVFFHDDEEFSSLLSGAIRLFEILTREPDCTPEELLSFEKIIEDFRIIEATRSSGWGRAICVDDYYRDCFENAKGCIWDD